MQDILLVGLSHKTAPLEVRESVSFMSDQVSEALPILSDELGEAVILATCNRSEIYTVTDDAPQAVERIHRFVAEYHDLPEESVSPHLYERTGEEAVRHLFKVSSGLDSMIVGEAQILGQVRKALSTATQANTAKMTGIGLFHAALRVGRRARKETNIGRNPLSISYAGVRLAQRVLGDISNRRALLIGAGEAGSLVARALRTVGVGDLMIANRTESKAQELAAYLSGTVAPFHNLEESLEVADIVIAATDSPSYVITPDMVCTHERDHEDSPLFAFDLAIPRDIDPEIAHNHNVQLFNIDDLSAIAEENMAERQRAAKDAELIVDDEVAKFMLWWDSLDALPTVKAIRRNADDIRRRELNKALDLLGDMSPEDRQVVETLTRSIVNKILHDPTDSLKKGATKSQIRVAKNLFRL
ncbi:MAG: glutamyl-tRNA reductase [Chloroflexi bacterium]|nr:glutamyl-tRNA reductase [Chloroflexota bacterium]